MKIINDHEYEAILEKIKYDIKTIGITAHIIDPVKYDYDIKRNSLIDPSNDMYKLISNGALISAPGFPYRYIIFTPEEMKTIFDIISNKTSNLKKEFTYEELSLETNFNFFISDINSKIVFNKENVSKVPDSISSYADMII